MVKDFAIALEDRSGGPEAFPAVSILDKILEPGLFLRLFDAAPMANDDGDVMFHQVLMTSAEAVALANALLAAASANEDRHAEVAV